MPHTPHQRVRIEDHGRFLAAAEFHISSDVLSAAVHVEPGHLPPGTRTRLVDAILDSPAARTTTWLHAAIPAGDGEILNRVRQRCSEVHARSAGASILLNGTLPHP